MGLTFDQIIDLWILGDESSRSGGLGNLKIKGNKLIHYETVIAEKFEEFYYLNMTRYSIQTSRVQKIIQEKIDKSKTVIVLSVMKGYTGNLYDYKHSQ